jgi:hypothetical protein
LSRCAAASASGIAGTEFDAGIYFKPVPQKIDLYGLRFFTKFFFHDKLETIYIEHTIVVFGLIQSHGQGRAASTACIQEDANRCDLFAIKVFLNLFGRFFSYFHHNILILLACFQLSSGILAGFVRSHLKNVFWPNIFVGASLQILYIQQYASGLKFGPAARVPAKPLGEDGILNQNPIFEMASGKCPYMLTMAWLFVKFKSILNRPHTPRNLPAKIE